MGSKKLVVVIGFLFLIVLFLGFVSSVSAAKENPIFEGCAVVSRNYCDSFYYNNVYVVMGLSSDTNAHGEFPDQGTYNHVLCCDFGGGDNSCYGTNKVVGLSSEINAHAEIPENENYNYDVCYESLECESFDDGCEAEYNIEMISLSDETNAHIGKFVDYSKKICCKKVQIAYWGDEDGVFIDEIEVVVGETSVFMFLKNTELSEGTEVSFDIYEDDPIFDDLIRTINGNVDSEGNVGVSWTVTQDDLDATGEEDFNYFYFIANGRVSGELIITIAETPENCASINFCMNYETQSTCESDGCEVASDSVKETNPEIMCGEEIDNGNCIEKTSCECVWDEIDGCGPSYETEVTSCDDGPETPLTIGKCSYGEDTEDDCEDGFLTYSWEGNWVWGEDNVFNPNPDGDDYVYDTSGWHYDPEDASGKRTSEKCADGNNIIPCPAQIQLPFFGLYTAIATLVLIALIYVSLILKKSRKK